MNCNDFKEKVVDLFDKDIDMQAQAQLREHMANCHDCKAYYDDLRKTFNILQPLDTANIRKTKITHRLWRYAAAVAIFLSVSLLDGIICFQHPLSLTMLNSPSCNRASKAYRTLVVSRWRYTLAPRNKKISQPSTLQCHS